MNYIGFERGYFDFYNRKDKRYLYIKGKKYNNYMCQNPTFRGTFTKYFPFDEEEYNKRKLENQRSAQKEKKGKLNVTLIRKPLTILHEEEHITKKRLADIFDKPETTIGYNINQYKLQGATDI